MLDAALCADDDGHLMDGIGVECGCQPDGLGKFGGAVTRHTMQRFAPPIIGRHAKSRDGSCLIHKLAGLLFQGHPVDQVCGALLGRQAGVKVGRLLLR